MTNIRKEAFLGSFPTPQEGDTLYIEAFVDDYPRSKMVVSFYDELQGCVGGLVTFEGMEDEPEYGELYSEDFHHIYHVDTV